MTVIFRNPPSSFFHLNPQSPSSSSPFGDHGEASLAIRRRISPRPPAPSPRRAQSLFPSSPRRAPSLCTNHIPTRRGDQRKGIPFSAKGATCSGGRRHRKAGLAGSRSAWRPSRRRDWAHPRLPSHPACRARVPAIAAMAAPVAGPRAGPQPLRRGLH